MDRVPLTSVDTAWLRMENPTNLMMITGLMVFGQPLDFERLKATIEHRLLRFDRFRQRVVRSPRPLGKARWEADPAFDLDNHLLHVHLAGPSWESRLRELVGSLMSTQLDISRPLWQMHVVEGDDGGSAIIARLHHCIADGVALVQVLLSLTDVTAQGRADGHSAWTPPARAPESDGLFGAASALVTDTAGALAEGVCTVLRHPSRVVELGKNGLGLAAALGRLVLRWPDKKTLFKGKLGTAKCAAWSEPLAIADVKAVGREIGGTVNDVLLAAVAGGLRRYLEQRGAPTEDVNLRAVIPVNLRPKGAELELGNWFSLVFLTLPVGIADPLQRLRELKRRMDGLKGSREPVAAYGIITAMGMAPEPVQDMVVDIFGTKATAVMTNVPGPTEKLYLAGAPLDVLMAWVPQSGRMGIGVSVISYAGEVRVGVATDRRLVPDPERIVSAYQTSFDELLELVQDRRIRLSDRTLPEMLEHLGRRLDEVHEALR